MSGCCQKRWTCDPKPLRCGPKIAITIGLLFLGVFFGLTSGMYFLSYLKLANLQPTECIPRGYWTSIRVCELDDSGLGNNVLHRAPGIYPVASFIQFLFLKDSAWGAWGMQIGCNNSQAQALLDLHTEFPYNQSFLCAWSTVTPSLWLMPPHTTITDLNHMILVNYLICLVSLILACVSSAPGLIGLLFISTSCNCVTNQVDQERELLLK